MNEEPLSLAKEQIRKLKDEQKIILAEYEFLHSTVEKLEGKYARQVATLQERVDVLEGQNKKLRAEIPSSEREDQAEATIARMQVEMCRLRELVKNSISQSEHVERRALAEQKFWEQLATDDVLQASTPPRGFPVPKGSPPAAAEVKRLKAKLGAAQREMADMRTMCDKMSLRNGRLIDKQQDAHREQVRQARQHSVLLKGAVRRLNWMVEQREEDRRKYADLQDYVAKVERKLVEASRHIKVLQRRLGRAHGPCRSRPSSASLELPRSPEGGRARGRTSPRGLAPPRSGWGRRSPLSEGGSLGDEGDDARNKGGRDHGKSPGRRQEARARSGRGSGAVSGGTSGGIIEGSGSSHSSSERGCAVPADVLAAMRPRGSVRREPETDALSFNEIVEYSKRIQEALEAS